MFNKLYNNILVITSNLASAISNLLTRYEWKPIAQRYYIVVWKYTIYYVIHVVKTKIVTKQTTVTIM